MSDYPPAEIELMFIREFSTKGNAIGKSQHRADRRERVRQAIYVGGVSGHRFFDSVMTYAEAFRECYGERLDRRAAARELPDPEGEDDAASQD